MLTKGQRLLAAFTTALNKHDPARFVLNGHVPAYEIEAISVLARFNEVHVGAVLGPEQIDLAHAALTEALRPWHGLPADPRFEMMRRLTHELVAVYCAESADE